MLFSMPHYLAPKQHKLPLLFWFFFSQKHKLQTTQSIVLIPIFVVLLTVYSLGTATDQQFYLCNPQNRYNCYVFVALSYLSVQSHLSSYAEDAARGSLDTLDHSSPAMGFLKSKCQSQVKMFDFSALQFFCIIHKWQHLGLKQDKRNLVTYIKMVQNCPWKWSGQIYN